MHKMLCVLNSIEHQQQTNGNKDEKIDFIELTASKVKKKVFLYPKQSYNSFVYLTISMVGFHNNKFPILTIVTRQSSSHDLIKGFIQCAFLLILFYSFPEIENFKLKKDWQRGSPRTPFSLSK